MENAETDCRKVLEHLYLYLDGELGTSPRAEIDAHLASCAECLDHVGFERDVLDVIGRKCRESAIPPGLLDQVRAKLREML